MSEDNVRIERGRVVAAPTQTTTSLDQISEQLGGDMDDTQAKLIQDCLGHKIVNLRLDDDSDIIMLFEQGTQLGIRDGGQDCCEQRYITTDDDLSKCFGDYLVSIKLYDAPSRDDSDGECHDVQFLRVKTDKAEVTFETHNTHNGYYGGFSIQAFKPN